MLMPMEFDLSAYSKRTIERRPPLVKDVNPILKQQTAGIAGPTDRTTAKGITAAAFCAG
jgi:hypothetical protein